MSLYRPARSPFYWFDFQIGGHRFYGSTKCRNKREAEAVERGERERAKALLKRSGGNLIDLTIDEAAGRYWAEAGRHHAGAADTWRDLERLIGYFGKDKRLAAITDGEVAELVAWRRGHRRWGRSKEKDGKPGAFISPATVNRSTTQVLQKLFTRARKSWRLRFDAEPDWRSHRLREPEERVRELHEDEGRRIETAMRSDYAPFFTFAMASGLRLRECLLLWSEVNWRAGQIVKPGKGGRRIVAPITPVVRAIVWPLRWHHPESVFTYVAVRTRGGRIKGERYPITFNGVKTLWRRMRAKAKVDGFRFHDFRHDLASRLLRETGNLKLVQKALNHARIATTTKYAHVRADEVADALARVQKSRKNSRTVRRRAS